MILFIIFQVINGNVKKPAIASLWFTVMFTSILHYLLARKWMWLAKWYNPIHTVILMCCVLGFTIAANPESANVDGFMYFGIMWLVLSMTSFE